MTILSRYIAKIYFKYWAVTLAALILLVLIGNLFGKIDRVLSSQANFIAFLDDVVRSLPFIIDLLLPMTVLLATVFTFSSLSRSSELVAIKSAGVGLVGQLRPIAFLLVFIAGLDYANQNYLYRWLGNKNALSEAASPNDQWHTSGNRIFYMSWVDSEHQQVSGVRMFEFEQERFGLKSFDTVANVRLTASGAWVLHDIVQRTFRNPEWQVRSLPREDWNEEDFPNVFTPQGANEHHIPLISLQRRIGILERAGLPTGSLWLEWHQKLAAAFAPFALAWFGTPLVQSHFRRGRASSEVMVSVLGGLVFLIATEILYTLGKGGFLHPFLAAWSVNASFVALGTVLYLRLR